jgi:serine phosphatase RsbU (regulator of sigma subunit)
MLPPSADRLALLYRISQDFNSSLDLDEVLNRVIDEVIAAVRAERGFLMLRDAAGQLHFRVARGIDRHTIEQPQFQVSRSVIRRVAEEGRPLLSSNAQDDVSLKMQRSVAVLGLRSILCVPLHIKGSLLGVIYVDNRLQSGIFQPADLDLLTAIASSAATAIENARLYQVAVEQGRLERELQMARDLQASLLPRETPHIAGWDFAAYWQPARQVSGDFYDFIPLAASFDYAAGAHFERNAVKSKDAPAAPLRMAVVIADVSDKGMPAALFMALSRTIVRASLIGSDSPADGLTQANRLICADSPNSMFVTLFAAQIDRLNGDLIYVNAGHNPPYLYRAVEHQPAQLARTGMALGIDAALDFGQREIHLDSGDVLILYTDGMLDALNARGEEFGDERLRRVCAQHRAESAAQVVAALRDEVLHFVGDQPLADDCTVVIVKRL